MNVDGKHYRTIWIEPGHDDEVRIIDQSRLPFEFAIRHLRTASEAAEAIRTMMVRGAGLIGATAGFGMYLGALESRRLAPPDFDRHMRTVADELINTRPTAVNLRWAVERQLRALDKSSGDTNTLVAETKRTAEKIAQEDAEACQNIGFCGVHLLREISRKKNGAPVNVLTHCNAGWLAFVDYGSATAPIYRLFDEGMPVHVWVDETRPRNQGSRLTAWELGQHGVPHTIVTDNAGGHLMQNGLVDIVITGSDRTTANGDVANKIGTYLKALAAVDNQIPFYVALPSSTFDWQLTRGVGVIPIEQRAGEEIESIEGLTASGAIQSVKITAPGSPIRNDGFDVTPGRLVTGLITERGLCPATAAGIDALFPEHRNFP